MTKTRGEREDAAGLRRRAEERLRGKEPAPSPQPRSRAETERLLQELQVHQIELEMQNEELRRASALVETVLEKYQDLYDFAPVGYFTLDRAGAIQEANLAGATLLGVERARLMQKRLAGFVSGKSRAAFDVFLDEVFSGKEKATSEVVFGAPESRVRHLHLEGAAAAPAEGGTPTCQIAATDITGLVHAEEEREKLRGALLHAQTMESVGRLAGGVAHDFNNMLGVVIGYAELVMGRLAADDPLQNNLREICKAARGSAGLTRKLLAFAARQAVVPKVVNLSETVSDMAPMLRRLVGENVHLVWKPKDGLWSIRMDPVQIDQILVNLAANARDAITGEGTLTIETANVTVKPDDAAAQSGVEPGDYVQLSVADTGRGMDDETRAHAFEPFFTTKGFGKGTGMGLAMVYGIVKQNHGFAVADSEPGRGTTLRILLPRHAGEAARISPAAPVPSVRRGQETVLLVENDVAVLTMAKEMLSALGYTVLPAGSADEAIRLAEAHAGKIDLVLTDVIMPRMNGRDLAKRLVSRDPKVRVLFMSGYPDDVIAQDGAPDGGLYFIQKPFSMIDLASKLREVLDEKQARA